MRYTPLLLGTGFGVNPERDDAKAKETKVSLTEVEDVGVRDKKWEDVGAPSNVLDYSNSAMLDFITLSYVSDVRDRINLHLVAKPGWHSRYSIESSV